LYIAYLQQVITKNKRGIPELGLDFASFATLVEGSLKVSNLVEDIQHIMNCYKGRR
jgi:hypothetical protein